VPSSRLLQGNSSSRRSCSTKRIAWAVKRPEPSELTAYLSLSTRGVPVLCKLSTNLEPQSSRRRHNHPWTKQVLAFSSQMSLSRLSPTKSSPQHTGQALSIDLRIPWLPPKLLSMTIQLNRLPNKFLMRATSPLSRGNSSCSVPSRIQSPSSFQSIKKAFSKIHV